MYCKQCKKSIENTYICPDCGMRLTKQKSRLSAGILQIFCGVIGLGRFYMGYKTYATLQILSSIVTCGIGGIAWGILDGIMILNGTVLYDNFGNLLE